MKKGISIWSFKEGPLKENFNFAKQIGFDGVEVAIAETGEINLSSSKDEILKVKEDANKAGIELYSVASGLQWKYSLTSDSEAEREKSKACVRKQLEIASYLGCDTILIVPGVVSAEFAPSLGVVDYETCYLRAIESVKELAKTAEELKVTIGVENVWNKFLLSPIEMKMFIDEIGSKWVGSYFDAGNVLNFGYPEHWIKTLGNRIKKVHIKDFKKKIGTLDGFCDLQAGDMDFEGTIKALKEIGYDGWVTAEMETYKINNELMLSHTSLAMDNFIKY
ncbi:MAG: sugar phosphate isomerase/epimerase family protein [Bacillota bacterium]|nr:sugar phosphate isomerase/epimerase family protein [Bacillota bacterium]